MKHWSFFSLQTQQYRAGQSQTWLAAFGLALFLTAFFPAPARAASDTAARQALLEGYATEARAADPAFAGFSARRGEMLFRQSSAAGDPRTPSCTSCHTDNPRQEGRNAKTGRPIAPVAVAITPSRFTEASTVEKQFGRDCQSVLGRPCTAGEKGDYITFMMEP